MDPEKSRIEADLRGQITGDVLCDDLTLQLYSSDASVHYLQPTGVVRPANKEDVIKCVQYAAENHLSLHPRGSGSNFVGSALGEGLILDFSWFMRRVHEIDRESARVQPGAVLSHVNDQLGKFGRRFGPDPLNRSVTTLGGMFGLNSCGSQWLKYGSPGDQIIEMEVVLADGTLFNTGDRSSIPKNLIDGLETIQKRRGELIDDAWPKTKVNNAGYDLSALNLNSGSPVDIARLICGSEGTLGIITELKVKTVPKPVQRGVALLFFDRVKTAAQVALELSETNVTACDLLDRRILTIAREIDSRYQRLIPAAAESMVFVELEAEENRVLSDQLERIIDRYVRRKKKAFEARSTTQKEERDFYWKIVRRAIPHLYKLKGRRRALPFLDDYVVPPQMLPTLLVETQSLMNQHEVTASMFAHFGQGTLRVYPLLDLSNESHTEKIVSLANDMHGHVIDLGGSISGSHGDGLSRTAFLRRQYGRLYDVFAEIKNVFDPQRILNPGIIVDSPRRELGGNLRPVQVRGAFVEEGDDEEPETNGKKKKKKKKQIVSAQLNWDANGVLLATRQCNGCARCRTTSSQERMCPIFRILPREEASPRAKANLMRGIMTGKLDETHLKSDEFKKLADLCVNCHQCRLECPANVDIPKLMVEAKSQNVSVNGLKMSEWLLTRLDFLYEFAARFPGLTNWMIRSPLMRWSLDKFLGVAQARKLPGFSRRSFVRWAIRNKLTTPSKGEGSKVLYFVDAFANWNDPELAQSTIRVLQHNGFEVFVPVDQLISGMSMISAGLIDRAKKIAAKNVEMMAEYVRQGYTIVATEPSAALALQHEYLNFLSDNDVQLVSDNTTDITTFLWSLHQQGKLELDFQPLSFSIGYHLPCHLRALRDSVPGWRLLKLIPALRVEQIEEGCSGMAGTYGLIKSNYRRSLRAGLGLINAIRSPEIIAGTTECSTCKIQMEQGTTKPTIHPVKILAHSYGIMPELEDLFARRSEKLMVS